MNAPRKPTPLRFMLDFFRWFCHPDYQEDIEGDLLERFYNRVKTESVWIAQWHFCLDILQLMRPGIVRDMKDLTPSTLFNLKPSTWITLIAVNLLIIIVIMLPFLPGPSNGAVIVLSAVAQAPGFLGLILVPLGAIWMFVEIRYWRNKNESTKSHKPVYRLAVTATAIIGVLAVFIMIGLYLNAGLLTTLFALVIEALQLRWAMRSITRLRTTTVRRMNPAPFYLVTIPLVALVARVWMVEPVSHASRDAAIQKSEQLITSIEKYKDEQGEYPPTLNDLESKYQTNIPGSSIMGILGFHYNRVGSDYSLSFSQWKEIGSLEEIVLYDKNNVRNNLHGKFAEYNHDLDLWRIKGAFASHDTAHLNWRYYLVD